MIVGELDLDVRAQTTGLESDLHAKLNVIAARAGDRFGSVLGKAMGAVIARDMRHTAEEAGQGAGESFARGAERGTARVARSGRLLAGVFTSNSAQALGPLQEVAEKFQLIGETVERTSSRAGGALLGIGAAATGVGAFLSTLASRDEAASKRLAAAISDSGGSISDFTEEIEKAVKGGERFGYQENQTLDALNTLTVGLHDPKKALEELGLAQDVAAERGIKLAAAADIVRQVYNGSPRALRQFGISADELVDSQTNLTKAQAASVTATKAVESATQSYTDKLAVYRDTIRPTLSQQLALKASHDKLVEATAKQAVAAQGLAAAQKDVTEQETLGDQKLAAVAERVRGEASAAADTFTGKLKAMGARVEDSAAKIGGKLGHELIIVGPALAGVGAIIESGLIPKIGRGVLSLLGFGAQAGVTAGEVAAASVAEDVSLATVVTAIRELQVAMTGIGPTMTAQAVETGVATTAMDAEIAGVAVAAETASTAASASFLAMLGPLGVVGIAVAGLGVAIKEALDTNHLTSKLDAQVRDLKAAEDTATTNKDLRQAVDNAIAAAKKLGVEVGTDGEIIEINPTAKNANQRARGEQILRDALAAQKFIGDPTNAPDTNDLDAKSAAHATAVGKHIGTAVAKGVNEAKKPQTLDDFLASMGLGPRASARAASAADKALAAAQKAAADRARELGNAVTAGIRAQIATVKNEASALTAQIKKITDFRASVLSAAGDFTKLSGLIDDPSTATAGRIASSLSNRLLGLQTFARNLQTLARRGLDRGVLAELAQGGPAQRAFSSALVAGSDEQIKALNATEKLVRQQDQVVAQIGTDAQFGPGALGTANAQLAKVNGQLAALNKQVAAQPALIAKAVDQARKNATVATKTKTRTAVPK